MEDDTKIDESGDDKIQTIDKHQIKDLMGEEEEEEADDEEDMDFSPDASYSSVNESCESSFEMDKVSKKTKSKTKSSVKRDVEASNVDDDDDDDDDSDSDVLHIHSDESEEEMVCENDKVVGEDDGLEEKLTEDASKNHLTANNVKNILRHVITSKEVVDMVKNTIATEDIENTSDQTKHLVEATYEPKMTRSKMKEVMEKGKIPQVWPLSPLKTGSKNKPSFLELEFTDDEDDEYNPDRDPVRESDDESTSFLSSQASDFGSPCPRTPSTPASHPRPSTSKKQFFVSPAVPVNKSVKTDLAKAFDNVAETDEEFLLREINSAYDTVARRTRSKLPLTSTSLIELESTLIEVAPDITEDMYDTNLGQDEEWQEFLSSLYTGTVTKIDVAPQESQEVGDDETNDPEYDYLGEAEHEEKDEEDYKYCRPYKIPKKEMFDLLDQLTEFMASDQEDEEGKRYTRGDSTESDENKKKKNKSYKPSTEGLQFTSSQFLILQDQIRRHIQLSTQFYFLCLGCDDYKHMTKVCVKHLNEFDMFRKASMMGEKSSYNVCNLTESLELIQQDRCWDIDKELEDIQSMSFDDTISNVSDSDDGFNNTDSTFKRQQAKCEAILESQKEIFWNNQVFFYPELLPKRRLMSLKEAKDSRVFFTPGEDKMIALAMDQFGTTPKHYNLIHKYLMPAKTVKQISFRVKNLASKRSQDNPVKLYKKKKILPENATLFHIFSIDSMIPPKQQNIDLLPKWCKKYKDSLEKKGKGVEECNKVEVEKVEDIKLTKKKNTRSFKTSTKSKKTPKKSPYKTPVPVSPKASKTQAMPTALITSAGLFVPIRYASPSKLPPDLQSAIIDGSPYQLPAPRPKTTPEKTDSHAAGSSNYFNTPTPDSTSQPSPCPVTDHLTNTHSDLPDSTDSQPALVSVNQPSSQATAKTAELTTAKPSQAIASVAPDSTGHSLTFSGDETSGKEEHGMASCPMDETEDQQTEEESCATLNKPGVSEQQQEKDQCLLGGGKEDTPKDIVKQPKHVGFVDLHSQASPLSDVPVQVLDDEKHLSDDIPSEQYQTSTVASSARTDNPIDKDSSRESTENKEEGCIPEKPASKTIVAVSQNNLSGILVTTPVPSPVNMEVFSTASSDIDTIHQKEAADTVTPTKNDKTDPPIADTSGSFLSTPSSLASSINSSTNTTPKTAVEIVATLAPFYNSYLVDPVVTQQSQLETTPKKYRELVPKSDLPQPANKQLFLSPKKKTSPKVTRLKRGVRAILPKGYVHDVKISPTKRAANQIKRKAAKIYHKGNSPNKLLLPKPPSFTDSLHYPNTRYQKQLNLNNSAVKSSRVTKRRLSESEKMEESDEHQSEVEDASASQDESQPEDDLEDVTIDDNLEELMAASTTIRFDPRKSSHQIHDNKTKAQRRREMNIALLAPDILESDPKRDDRDTAFAQAYMHQVKETLSDDMETYEQFLLLMCEFGKGTQSPINVFTICTIIIYHHHCRYLPFAHTIVIYHHHYGYLPFAQ
ncbi:hypothetical protein LOTGIDRAFT_237968 [Lottia gigantea]|uniref:Myb-like domain-containing protein n=1 Tax=Lottia gigantea TaxID=225164 RepID=V4AEN0_LOTGI|nr:hypothetical protein LOTGIDRAFT_237968 [Lottia gigantea]ESP02469.1 hypothetical protein LOTGIDRAFT_237968 [Lottia gigantea]